MLTSVTCRSILVVPGCEPDLQRTYLFVFHLEFKCFAVSLCDRYSTLPLNPRLDLRYRTSSVKRGSRFNLILGFFRRKFIPSVIIRIQIIFGTKERAHIENR